ncbi:hypothetical protein E1301_Tti005324 [Triplophysa tibetana]|uniref:EGF-like domain-containing protein n=1 Tax=Triplophysa tibetana TaxID=1572043 RepID=A0A5A9PN25_9TELE|nr:hypothetical protein E1301_Tti005324 [Triplophysa tibetana]
MVTCFIYCTTDPASTTGAVTTTVPVISTVNVTTGKSSTPLTTKTTTVKPIACKNGGTPFPNNEACHCPTGFTGITCDTAVPEIQLEKIERPVQVEVDISEEFTSDYNDPETDKYKTFVERFKTQMKPYYNKTIEYFARVEVIKLSEGTALKERRRMRSLPANKVKQSVKVRHDVVLDIPNNDNNDDEYMSAFDKVIVALEDLKNDSANLNISILNFTAEPAPVDGET